MSDAVICEEKSFVVTEAKEVGALLDDLHERCRNAVRRGAGLGAIVTELSKQDKQAVWVWLRSLPEDVREDVIRFSLKSHATMMRDTELGSTAQLTFALADPTAPAAGMGAARPQRQEGNVFSEFGQAVMRSTIKLADLMEAHPKNKWTDQTREQVTSFLAPLAAPMRELGLLVAIDADVTDEPAPQTMAEAIKVVEVAVKQLGSPRVLRAWGMMMGEG